MDIKGIGEKRSNSQNEIGSNFQSETFSPAQIRLSKWYVDGNPKQIRMGIGMASYQ
jgi:hypothetical protein